MGNPPVGQSSAEEEAGTISHIYSISHLRKNNKTTHGPIKQAVFVILTFSVFNKLP